MKSDRRRFREEKYVDPEFVEALENSASGRRSGRKTEWKTRQFCRQVQRALNLALADDAGGVFVDEVLPAPDCGRLLVQVIIPETRECGEAMEALRRDTPKLRSAVASAITRKRAPELSFVPVAGGGGNDE